MSVPFTPDDLGEEDYRDHPAPTPDRHIDFQQTHVPFYAANPDRTNFDGVPQPDQE